MAVRNAYVDFVRQARGDGATPYSYQVRIAEEGLPEVLSVPTGCGKTAAVVLGWLFRRRAHPDPAVRVATPHWLVYTLPQRVLVEQTFDLVRHWLEHLGLADEVGCHLAIGGAGRDTSGRRRAWRDDVDRDAVLVGTQDMLLSRQLNRGYGDSRWVHPVDYGLLNAGCHFVYDETQLMGPALPTSRQLHGLRRALGVAAPCSSTWMSATLDETTFRTVDCPDIRTRHELPEDDRSGPLRIRLEATKRIGRIDAAGKTYARDLAAAVLAEHQPGTRSIVVLNTVDRALEVRRHLTKSTRDVPVVLVHSRFRPDDRQRHIAAALAEPGEAGTIVVTTQVLEAGVDVTSHLLVTEAAPWPSVVQRAGRCNRDGHDPDAQLRWVPPPSPLPYEPADIDAAVDRLAQLDGASATPAGLSGATVEVTPITHPVLRRRDLLELFDTLPDLSGNDIDVGRFIRDADERTVELAWADLRGAMTPDLPALPAAAERCPAPVAGVRRWLTGNGRVFRHDHLEGQWVACRSGDIRPGMVLVADAAAGGYDPDDGWAPGSKTSVSPVHGVAGDGPDEEIAGDLAVEDDPGSIRKHWQGLAEHCNEVGAEAHRLLDVLDPIGITPTHRTAAVLAARLHDIGKAHFVFQESMTKLLEDGDRTEADACGPPWAKSGSDRPLRHGRRYFRHELASALMLFGEGRVVVDDREHGDLVRYLVAAHHGRARLGVRSLRATTPPQAGAPAEVLGVRHGDAVDAVDLGDLVVPASTLDLGIVQLGDDASGEPSWSERMLALRDDPELGPLRLGYLEAVVRLADWRASQAADEREGS